MSGLPQFDDALERAALDLIRRGFRIAMVQLGWDAAAGEKTLVRTPPAKWQSEPPLRADEVRPAIEAGCNAYLWRLPDGWWVVDADTAELTAEYTALLGPPDVHTPRGAHWVVDAPAKRLHKLDTGVRAFYGPSSYYPGDGGRLRAYVGVVPDRPRALPEQLRRPGVEFGPVTPGQPTPMTPEAASFAVSRARDEWLASMRGSRHTTLVEYFAVLARARLAQGAGLAAVAGELQAAADEHPDAQAGEQFETVEGLIGWAIDQARAAPWVIREAQGFEGRFAAPDPGGAPGGEPFDDWGEDDDPDAFTDDDFDGLVELERPTHGAFGGSRPLLYPDKVHWLQGESGSGKTWVALAVAVQVADEFGERVWIIDYENSRREFAARLKGLGVSREGLRRVSYTAGNDMPYAELRARTAARKDRYGLVIVDGVSSALTAAGKSGNDAQEFGAWFDQIAAVPDRMVICIDHVTKATDDRKGMALGTQAKKGRPGVTFEVRCTKAFKRGVAGTIELVLQIDRYGGLPLTVGERMQLTVESSADGTKVQLHAMTSSAAFMADPYESLFSALYADGLAASCSVREFATAVREAGAKVRNDERTRLRDAYMAYWADRENEGQPVDNPVDNLVH